MELYEHQMTAIKQLKTGSILCGGVGSGKSRTALAYFYTKECGGSLENRREGVINTSPPNLKPLYIITTARKRDTKEWEGELAYFNGLTATIDSWNNIGKYASVCGAFFIFDEQRVVGKGAWVKSFLQICKKNNWILLSATPGDTWMDYIPVFIANGFYKNRTEFIRRHVVFNRFVKYPKVDHYIDCGRLIKLRRDILVNMKYIKHTESHNEVVRVEYNEDVYNYIIKKRKNPYFFPDSEPIENASALLYLLRQVVNSDASRIEMTKRLILEHPKSIVFYNFDYELDILRKLCKEERFEFAEWNGHKHQPLPKSNQWVYLVQYTAGAEGWNCTTTNVIIFYSQNYSYRILTQAAGRIDRLNTPYSDLYYYHIRSDSSIDTAISRTLNGKKTFNEKAFFEREIGSVQRDNTIS